MKIQIKSLRAVNIGPLKDVTLDFTDSSGAPRQNTLLGGANGNGKTTVLELIFGLAESLDPAVTYKNATLLKRVRDTADQYAQLDLVIDGEPFSVFYGEKPYDAQLPLQYIGEETEGHLWLKDNPHTRYGDSEQGNNLDSLNRYFYLRQEIERSNNKLLTFARGERTKAAGVLNLPTFLYFPHSRQLIPSQGENVQREETHFEWAHRYETIATFSGSLSSYLIWLEYAEPEEFRMVADFLSEQFQGKLFGVNRRELKAIVTLSSGQVHNVEDLSSGEQNLLILLLELRRRLLPDSIVMIDEIENSLHPAFQYKIGLALKKLQEEIPFQLIVTSHAPAFLEIIGAENTLLLPDPQIYDTDHQAAA
ncbi:hypothetical protein CCAX7_20320 [Capsulimonas corticalis]|uniref:Uncharacterized protein n=1 Tax=Capsulimonas corticalis TaxID=2219043 RepID=A0A402D2E7_9BACT|nr:AAA family ATPase [Capsulimonas corticalis]BDI29981.1 hypothetical protein CCAX7_20320 [Capsulimonas corticalis]